MATNLVGDVCIGQHSLCLLRVSALDTDCSPLGGADSGIVSLGMVSMSATAEVEEGRRIEPKNGCGQISYTYSEQDVIKRYTISGEMNYHDIELKRTLFGGTLIVGHATNSDFPGENIGFAERHHTSTQVYNGVYLEVIVKAASATAGDCAGAAANLPYAVGYIFGRAKLRPGDRTFDENNSVFSFTGTAEGNPNLFNGPWNDYPGVGYTPNSPVVEVQYSLAEYQAMLAVARCGYQTLPAAS